jgi:hypothetical protein
MQATTGHCGFQRRSYHQWKGPAKLVVIAEPIENALQERHSGSEETGKGDSGQTAAPGKRQT